MVSSIGLHHNARSRLAIRGSSIVALSLGLAASTVGVNFAGTYVVSAALIAVALIVAVGQHGISSIIRQWNPADKFAIAFLSWTVFSETYNSIELHHAPNFGTITLWILTYLASWAARLSIIDRHSLARFCILFSVPAVPVAAIAVAQMLKLPGVNELLIQFAMSAGLEQRLSISREIRATSLIGHQIGLGAYLCAVLALLGAFVIIARNLHLRIGKAAALWITSFVGQLAAVTFATTVTSIAIAISIASKIRIRPWLIATILVSALIGWGVFGSYISKRYYEQTNSASEAAQTYRWLPETIGFRVSKWTAETIPASMHRPLTGWGYGVYEAATNNWPIVPNELVWMSPESEWFRSLVCAGFPALFLEIALLISSYRTTFRPGPYRDHLYPIKTLFICIVTASFIHNHFSAPGANIAFWSIIGACWGSMRKSP